MIRIGDLRSIIQHVFFTVSNPSRSLNVYDERAIKSYPPNQIILCLRIFNPSFDQQYSYLVFGPLEGAHT